MSPFSWPQVGQIVRHTQSNRVVKVLRVGDTIDCRSAGHIDPMPNFPNVSPVDLEPAGHEDQVRFILAELKTGKVFLNGHSKNSRRFTITFEKDVDGALTKLLESHFDDVRVTGKAADVLLRDEQPVAAIPNPATASDPADESEDDPADDKDALIKELQNRLLKTAADLDEAEAKLAKSEADLEAARERETDLLADLEARDLRDQDASELSDSNGQLTTCKEVVTLYHSISLPDNRERGNADLARYLNEGWEKFDCAIIANPDEDTMRIITLVRTIPASLPAPRPAAHKIVTPVGPIVVIQPPNPDLAEVEATLTAMADDPDVKTGDFSALLYASRLSWSKKRDLEQRRHQLIGQQIATRRPTSTRSTYRFLGASS